MLVKIKPKMKRAYDRVNSHGELMLLKVKNHNSFLVESLNTTWRGQKWTGWFTDDEAEYQEEVIKYSVTERLPNREE